jgi:alpha-tubulin suppressor-like RCC1 family protein
MFIKDDRIEILYMLQRLYVLSLLCIGTAYAQCTPGHSGGVAGPCIRCVQGSFAALSSSLTCRKCPMNMTTVDTGSTSLVDCVCDDGFAKDPFGFCVECPPELVSNPGADVSGSCVPTVVHGYYTTCALWSDSGKIKCWGINTFGQLGQGYDVSNNGPLDKMIMGDSLPFVNFGDNGRVKQVVPGSKFTCVVFDSGKVKCFGEGVFGKLGMGNTQNAFNSSHLQDTSESSLVQLGTNRTVFKLVTQNRADHVCALLDNKTVKCWGHFGGNFLGNFARGDGPDEMGDSLPSADMGTQRHVLDIWGGSGSPGSLYCVLLNTAEVKCWGTCNLYQCGWESSGSANFRPNQYTGTMGNNLQAMKVPEGRTVISLAMSRHTLLLLDDYTIVCFGADMNGVCATGTGVKNTEYYTAIENAGRMVLPSNEQPVQIDAGPSVTLVLMRSGKIASVGNNAVGSVGTGATGIYGISASTVGENISYVNLGNNVFIKSISAQLSGTDGNCAVLSTNQLKCWGQGYYGQLGLSDTDQRGNMVYNTGTNLPVIDIGSTPLPTCAGAGQPPECIDTRCGAGFASNNAMQCVACVAGTYKASYGHDRCSECPVGTYSATTGAESSNTCLQCAAYTNSMTAGAANSSMCLQCPTNSVGLIASDGRIDCKCIHGFYASQ